MPFQTEKTRIKAFGLAFPMEGVASRGKCYLPLGRAGARQAVGRQIAPQQVSVRTGPLLRQIRDVLLVLAVAAIVAAELYLFWRCWMLFWLKFGEWAFWLA